MGTLSSKASVNRTRIWENNRENTTAAMIFKLTRCHFFSDIKVVPEAGLEPASLAAGDFESPASTSSATRARSYLGGSFIQTVPAISCLAICYQKVSGG